ncbi:NAD-dependent dihydropyrimidine dehydrogenase subunit PreA [Elusimicrobiota bacterium]
MPKKDSPKSKQETKIDLSTNCGGIKAPNPFWLASGPPTNSGEQVMRAFEQGWGGVVWKTMTQDPPILNVTSRYGALDIGKQKMAGFNNIELTTDRSLDDNLREISEVKKKFPKHAVVASMMVPCEKQQWQDIVKKVEDAGCDGLELNFGCPHGLSERGMGAAVGQVPEYVKMVTEFVKEISTTPVIVKLTPNVTDIRYPARAAKAGGANGVALINTIKSFIGVDLDTLQPKFSVDGKIAYGGYCGPAVKPIALYMVSTLAADNDCKGLAISGIGGISNWVDAAEFMLLGASSIQVCTAVMHHGFKIVDPMIKGLSGWMLKHGFVKIDDFAGKTVSNVVDWGKLNLHAKTMAAINKEKCIGCGICLTACRDSGHRGMNIDHVNGNKIPYVAAEYCVGCNLCSVVCPVNKCITMKTVETGHPPLTWEEYIAQGQKGYKGVHKR